MYLRQLIKLRTIDQSIYFSPDLVLHFADIKSNIVRERKYLLEFLSKFNSHSLIIICNLNCSKDIVLQPYTLDIKANDFVQGVLNIYEYKDNKINKFFMLMDSEYETIMNYTGTLDKYNLLNLFCNLKSRMKRNAENVSPAEREPEVAYPSYEQIMDDIFIESHKTLKQYIDALDKLDLIRYDYAGDMVMEKNGQIITRKSNFTYTLFRPQWDVELENSISLLKSKKRAAGWKFRSKQEEVSADVKRSITQKIHMLEKKIENKTLTLKDKKELTKLKKEQDKWKTVNSDIDVRKLEEDKLQSDNPGKSLSEIYHRMNFIDKAIRAKKEEDPLWDGDELDLEIEYGEDNGHWESTSYSLDDGIVTGSDRPIF